jgi:hypothetical protein
MLQTFLIVLLALSVRDLLYEFLDWFQGWRHRRNCSGFPDGFNSREEWEEYLDDLNP